MSKPFIAKNGVLIKTGTVELPSGYVPSSDLHVSTKAYTDAKMNNPMTSAGDIVVGGANGAPSRLAKGTDGQVLTLASGVPSWANSNSPSKATASEIDTGTDDAKFVTAKGLLDSKYLNESQVQNGGLIYASDGGSSDSYAITLNPAPSAYVTGMVVNFKANTVNTGSCTINVNSLGAKTIKKNYDVDLSDGDIKAGQLVNLIYDGTNFQMISPVSAVGGATVERIQHIDFSNVWSVDSNDWSTTNYSFVRVMAHLVTSGTMNAINAVVKANGSWLTNNGYTGWVDHASNAGYFINLYGFPIRMNFSQYLYAETFDILIPIQSIHNPSMQWFSSSPAMLVSQGNGYYVGGGYVPIQAIRMSFPIQASGMMTIIGYKKI